jgi:hypothetical protein
LQFFNLFSNSYEFWTIDCSLNSFRNGKRLDRTMGHIFQRPNPVVGCVAQQHSSSARHCVARSRSWLAHGHTGPALVLTYTTLGGAARLASASVVTGRGATHRRQWLDIGLWGRARPWLASTAAGGGAASAGRRRG